MSDDRRLIEDYLPIQAISAEASREKSVRKGHISTLHLWWARRPLVACRAAVYGALVPASQFVPNGGSDAQKKSLGRANAAKFIERLCQYPGSPEVIKEAQEHILKAHAERLNLELRNGRREENPSLQKGRHDANERGGDGSSPDAVSSSTLEMGTSRPHPVHWPAHASRPGNQSLVTSAATPAWVAEYGFQGDTVTVEDIVAGRAPRPKVLDMFAGGGAIPLEALRLGCEAYALDLNPVAHIIQLCTLVYPQKFGKPDANAKGSAKDGTWAGLAAEVEHWGNWVLEKVKTQIGDLYPPIPDPQASGDELGNDPQETMGFAEDPEQKLKVKRGFLTPVAYLWTRTVRCKNPACGATVPLLKQTWLCKKKDRCVAMRVVAPKGEKRVRFEIVEAKTETGFGFNPEEFSKGGNATCPFCGTVADLDYVKSEGCSGRIGEQMMAIICVRDGKKGKVYLSSGAADESLVNGETLRKRISEICAAAGFSIPNEPVPQQDSFTCKTHLYGLTTWASLFNARQLACLVAFVSAIREAQKRMDTARIQTERRQAIACYLAFVLDRLADWNSSLCSWSPENTGGAKIGHTFGRQALHMVWDYAESAVWGEATGSVQLCQEWVIKGLSEAVVGEVSALVIRGSAMQVPLPDSSLDAVITDPPYYDNVSYANLSDFFYVWLRRSIGQCYGEHFASELTPKKAEAVAEASRFGSKSEARRAYEEMMAKSFAEANRLLKPAGQMIVVYAHKTTLGWTTLVDALRNAGFTVVEAWPVDTEMKARLLAMDTAALASSIFLIARKRDGAKTGSYEDEVRPELEQIVRERVETLWRMGITGADLIIAAVGAGLRAFTRFVRVEYANGEEVPAEEFLGEVESVVLETLLEKIFSNSRSSRREEAQTSSSSTPDDSPSTEKSEPPHVGCYRISGVDGPSRFYVLWRYAYRTAELDAGEAIVFTYGQPVELDGADGLANGTLALVEKKKGKYRLRDYTERGPLEKLGLPDDEGKPAPLVDSLHRLLWLMENEPRKLSAFLDEAHPDRERLRLVAQALAGAGLSGGSEDQTGVVNTTPSEQAALGKLLANWRALVPETLFNR